MRADNGAKTWTTVNTVTEIRENTEVLCLTMKC